ncbi:MAG: TonB-dependent receptor plug domain-containing protein [Bacteroidales bacterium]|nr:TonB-dependent receptor plug domain-containing protein [Bacteroidales bacterium]MBR5056428.1 TonB-dependent receptor plug domain-containing protein [Bacteroidales bacterium]
MKRTVLPILILFILSGCGSSSKLSSESEDKAIISDGYTMVSEKNSAHSVSKKEKEKRYYSSIYSLLETVSGVSVDGDVIRVRRGSGSIVAGNDPLFLVDGVETGSIRDLNPNDVHSVEVLKDSSAAIYGARGANGVILITTEGAYAARKAEIEARKAARAARKAEKKAK